MWEWIGRCSIFCCLVVNNHSWAGGYASQVASHFDLCDCEHRSHDLNQSYRNSAELSWVCSDGISLAQFSRVSFTSGQWIQVRRINFLLGNRRESTWGWVGRCSLACCPVIINHHRAGGCRSQVVSLTDLSAFGHRCQICRNSAELIRAYRWKKHHFVVGQKDNFDHDLSLSKQSFQ